MKLLKIVFLLLFNLTFAQSISNDWTPIYSDEESIVYLNSSKIVGYGNEISAWAIENLVEISQLANGEKIARIKTHYLFNKIKKRFAEIGIIYYDDKGQIVNRSSKSNFQGTSTAFMAPVKSDPKVEIIYKEVISFLITGNIKSIDEAAANNSIARGDNSSVNENNSIAKVDETNAKVDSNFKMEIPATHRQLAERHMEDEQFSSNKMEVPSSVVQNEKEIIPNTSVGAATLKATENSDNAVDLKKENWSDIPKIDERLEIEQKPAITKVESSNEINKDKIDESINIQVPARKKYNSSGERALKNSIFTDGDLFCFQVSSWKTKAYADRELNKLISEGYSAFIFSVKPKHKRSIWHRVRVGYFNSLQETKRVQRLVGKR